MVLRIHAKEMFPFSSPSFPSLFGGGGTTIRARGPVEPRGRERGRRSNGATVVPFVGIVLTVVVILTAVVILTVVIVVSIDDSNARGEDVADPREGRRDERALLRHVAEHARFSRGEVVHEYASRARGGDVFARGAPDGGESKRPVGADVRVR